MTGSVILVGIVGTDGSVYYIDFPNAGGRISIPVDQCRITSSGVTVKLGCPIKILTLPERQPAANQTLYRSSLPEEGTSYICIGARPDLDIPGVLIDENTGRIVGTYST